MGDIQNTQKKTYIMALDQGTTSSRCILFDKQGNICSMAQKEFTQIYPQPGWVEHNPMEIWSSQLGVAIESMAVLGITDDQIEAIGITNQRETTILWDKNTGEPVYNAIVWQCRRTSDMIEELKKDGFDKILREKTGLIPDAYFSASKIAWILNNVPGARERAERGELLFGTVDTWLIWNLTKGAVHVTDYTNASRTMLFDIHNLCWDQEILKRFNIPESLLPKVCCSSEIYGKTDASVLGGEIPIAGAAGDQQAALFGQTCFSKGQAKNTYGTGCFLLMNTGKEAVTSKSGMLTTLAASADGEVRYALEGSVFTAGAVVQWLRDEMRFLTDSSDSDYYASKVKDSGGVYMVPAFNGLGAPHWDMFARGMLIGITRGTKRSHIIRACMEAIAYQSKDLLDAISADVGVEFQELRVDGGASANEFLMQFQADIIGKPVCRPVIRETTALGAAYLAGLAVQFWSGVEELKTLGKIEKTYQPQMDEATRARLLKGWHRAVERAKNWIDPEDEE